MIVQRPGRADPAGFAGTRAGHRFADGVRGASGKIPHLSKRSRDSDYMHIHILGICGTFMGGLAVLAKEAGHKVTGCDANVYPPMSTQLEAQGIELVEGFDSGQIALKPDLFVVGNAISRGNPLLEEILARHTGQPIDRIHNDTDRDFVMEADAALAYGVIDEIITERKLADRSGPIR